MENTSHNSGYPVPFPSVTPPQFAPVDRQRCINARCYAKRTEWINEKGGEKEMNSSEIGVNKFKDGYNCAQSVLFSLNKHTGLSEDYSLKIATGFGAGMGRTQHVCGAISGGILALNILYGRGLEEGKEKQEDVYVKIRELIQRFERRNTTIVCKDLLDGCDLVSEDGQDRFNSENMIEKCHSYIARVIEIVEEVIEEN